MEGDSLLTGAEGSGQVPVWLQQVLGCLVWWWLQGAGAGAGARGRSGGFCQMGKKIKAQRVTQCLRDSFRGPWTLPPFPSNQPQSPLPSCSSVCEPWPLACPSQQPHSPGPSPIWTVLMSLTSPLMLAEGPKAEMARGGRLPGTLTVVRSKSISLPWVLWM